MFCRFCRVRPPPYLKIKRHRANTHAAPTPTTSTHHKATSRDQKQRFCRFCRVRPPPYLKNEGALMSYLQALKQIKISPPSGRDQASTQTTTPHKPAPTHQPPTSSAKAHTPPQPTQPHDWPHGEAWNAQEMHTFMDRVGRLCKQGLRPRQAEQVAERLLNRDRDLDDRRMCLECAHLNARGYCGAAPRPSPPPVDPAMLWRCSRAKMPSKVP